MESQQQLPAFAQRIAEEFSRTIFWNWLEPWPVTKEHPEEPLRVLNPAPVYCRRPDEDPPILLRFESGELSIDVATLPAKGDDPDFGNVTSDMDAAFIAALPVTIPALLGEIASLRAIVAKSREEVAEEVRP